jgi:hypothetical protein
MGMQWFLLVIVGVLLWVVVSSPLIRWRLGQFRRKTRKAGKLGSRLAHPPNRG